MFYLYVLLCLLVTVSCECLDHPGPLELAGDQSRAPVVPHSRRSSPSHLTSQAGSHLFGPASKEKLENACQGNELPYVKKLKSN